MELCTIFIDSLEKSDSKLELLNVLCPSMNCAFYDRKYPHAKRMYVRTNLYNRAKRVSFFSIHVIKRPASNKQAGGKNQRNLFLTIFLNAALFSGSEPFFTIANRI